MGARTANGCPGYAGSDVPNEAREVYPIATGPAQRVVAAWRSSARSRLSARRTQRSRSAGEIARPKAGSDALREERLDECLGVEWQEVADLLPHSDEPHRDVEGVLDRKHDPALRGRVELGQDNSGQADGLVERLGLSQSVLPGRRLE